MSLLDHTPATASQDYVILEELLQPTMDEIDAIAMAGGRAAGVPTGFADLDTLTNGLHPGQMIIVAARPGIGPGRADPARCPESDRWLMATPSEAGVPARPVDGGVSGLFCPRQRSP